MKTNTNLITDLKKDLIKDIENIKNLEGLKAYLENIDNLECQIENTISEYEDIVEEFEVPISFGEKYVLFGKGYSKITEVIGEIENCFEFSDTYMKFHIKEVVDNGFILEMQGKEDITDLTDLSIFDTMKDSYKLSVLKMYDSYYFIETDKMEEQLLKIENEIIDTVKTLLEDKYNRKCFYTRKEYKDYIENEIEWIWK